MVSLEERTLNSVTCAGAVALCFAFLLTAVFPFVGGDALGTALRAESHVAKTNRNARLTTRNAFAAQTATKRARLSARTVAARDCVHASAPRATAKGDAPAGVAPKATVLNAPAN